MPEPTPSAIRRCLFLWLVAVWPAMASAANWTVCDFSIRTVERGEHAIRAVVVSASRSNPPSCFQPGAEIEFAPETADYQQVLPRRQWPRRHQRSRLRYRELDGWCKNDGAPGPCTIRHYSIL